MRLRRARGPLLYRLLIQPRGHPVAGAFALCRLVVWHFMPAKRASYLRPRGVCRTSKIFASLCTRVKHQPRADDQSKPRLSFHSIFVKHNNVKQTLLLTELRAPRRDVPA